MLGYQNSCSKATPFESCECRAETEDHWFGAFSATWVWKAKGSIKYPQLPDWIEDRADDIPSPLPISEGRMCGSTSLFGDGAIIESAVWRHLSAIKVCESVRSLMDVSNPQRNRTRQ